ncbi:hypothetical protein FKW77_009575 [Venturia effusa]|uniref:Uncharacterized protein n=1 Tax=Venturia effusa TaxID=50376 RepID=A0A517L453_9PEZI|nr:hypothetical protein FKW77_009575 [Venturia effusa]
MPGAMDPSLWGGCCVPQIFCRRIPGKDGRLESIKLIFDDWRLPRVVDTGKPEYGQSGASQDTNRMFHVSWAEQAAAGGYEAESCELDCSVMEPSGIAPPTFPELEDLKEELLDCGCDVSLSSELRSLREELVRCGNGRLLEPPPVHEFMEESVSPEMSNKDGWACLKTLNAKEMIEFIPGEQYLHSAQLGRNGGFISQCSLPSPAPRS